MKNKKMLISLVVALIILLVLAYQYLSLRQSYNNLKDQVKYEITSHLSSSMDFANRIDLDKLAVGDKNSIINMMYMYGEISNLDAILTTTYFYGKIDVIDPLVMRDYKFMLMEIVNKLTQNQFNSEDIDNINMITDDIKEIYKYVSENSELSSEKYIKELAPELKLYQKKQGK